VGEGVEVAEVPEEKDGGGKVDERVHEDVGQEDYVGWVTHDFHGESGVWSKEVGLDDGVDVFGVPEGEDLRVFGLAIIRGKGRFVWWIPLG
jgi:hypothetical protein